MLRSDIRLMPSDIRCASCAANRISLKPQGFNITIAIAIISLFAKAKNITKSRKRESKAVFLSAMFSLCVLLQVSHLFNKCIGLCPYPYFISPIRTTEIGVAPFLGYCALDLIRHAYGVTPSPKGKAWGGANCYCILLMDTFSTSSKCNPFGLHLFSFVSDRLRLSACCPRPFSVFSAGVLSAWECCSAGRWWGECSETDSPPQRGRQSTRCRYSG